MIELITEEQPTNREAFTLANLTARMLESQGDDEAMALWAEAVESAGEEFGDHVQSVLDSRDAVRGTIAGLEYQIERLSNLRAARVGYVERVEKSVLSWLEMCGLTALTLPRHTIKIRINPPSVHVEDPALVPDEYWKVKETRSLDKMALKAAIQGGSIVDSCSIIQTKRLEIK